MRGGNLATVGDIHICHRFHQPLPLVGVGQAGQHADGGVCARRWAQEPKIFPGSRSVQPIHGVHRPEVFT